MEHWAEIIREVAQSPLGFIALITLVISTIAIVFFRRASARIKLFVFLLLILGSGGLVTVVVLKANLLRGIASEDRELDEEIPSGSELERAHDLYKSEDYEQSFPLFEQLAEQGNAIAMFYVGRFYRKGHHVRRNEDEARIWFTRAFSNLKELAEQGNVPEMYYLGRMYRNGYGTAKDYDEAISWYIQAADYGYTRALYRIGEIYQRKQDYDNALAWYQKAADTGDHQAQNKIEEIRNLRSKSSGTE